MDITSVELPYFEEPILLATNSVSRECGTTLWSSGRALSRYLAANKRKELRGANIAVDLGSGCGIVGLACARAGVSRVFLTDTEDIVSKQLMQSNASLNRFTVATPYPDTCDLADVNVLPLNWGHHDHITHIINLMQAKPELILGADVVYSMDAVEPLVGTLSALSGGRTQCYIAHEKRDPLVAGHFLKVLKERQFSVKKLSHDEDPEFVDIYLVKCRIKNDSTVKKTTVQPAS
ncbi:putative methyltransferase-domain-containing protein [Cladochytrium replicatum]|nr:putative methyltransferase-domain-containing protein [Cladochytrium replicatum]